jgi:hypothetical protein
VRAKRERPCAAIGITDEGVEPIIGVEAMGAKSDDESYSAHTPRLLMHLFLSAHSQPI